MFDSRLEVTGGALSLERAVGNGSEIAEGMGTKPRPSPMRNVMTLLLRFTVARRDAGEEHLGSAALGNGSFSRRWSLVPYPKFLTTALVDLGSIWPSQACQWASSRTHSTRFSSLVRVLGSQRLSLDAAKRNCWCSFGSLLAPIVGPVQA